MLQVTQALLTLLATGQRGALATVVRVTGSTPQHSGARMLLLPDGSAVGTVGGGAVEQAVLVALRECRDGGKPTLVTFDLGRDLGMCCGGSMELFVEPVESRPRLLLFGAGHVGHATARMARLVGFSVTVIDDREELNTEERFSDCERVLAEPAEAARRLEPRPEDWVLVVTHDHRLDEEALDTYARLPHRYLGVIGSKRKIVRILQRIAQRGGVPPLERVYAPVGLDLGAVTPEEIAVSITAELVALRHGKPGAHMRIVDAEEIRSLLHPKHPRGLGTAETADEQDP